MAQVKVQTPGSLCGSSLSPTMQLPSVNSSGPLALQVSVNGTAPAPTCTSPAAVVADSGVSPNSPASLQDNMANPKEKTPMCLVNELARFNRNQPQYNLLSERGPAHAKIFTVQLNLGEQSWEAEGTSIKKAQHAAAALALKETTLPRPSPRPPKNNINSNPGSITPTVELNGLAMKRGEPAIYRPLDSKPLPNYRGNYNFRGMYNQRYYYPVPKIFYVQLTVGNSEFIGEGRTRQAARHNAAMKALQALRNEPIPEKAPQLSNKSPTVDDIRAEEAQDWLKKLNEDAKEQEEPKETQDDKDANKSEISLVFEIALKRNMPVNFEVIKESGPPHMKSFVTRVTVGEFIAEGEGNSKKLSKKRAAIAVLQELKKLPPLPVIEKPKLLFKKRPKTILKTGPEYGQGMNPISRLAQIQQAKKEKEPEYMLLSERGMPRRREFVMQVKVGNEGATGTGPSKKVAKRNAAEAMLLQLGYKASTPLQTATEKALSRFLQLKGPEPNENKAWNGQTSSFPEQTGNSQKGILHLSPDVYQEMEASRNKGTPGSTVNFLPHKEISQNPSAFFNNTAAIPRELLLNGASPAAEAIGLKGKAPSSSSVVVQPTQQLEYLARIQGFQAALSALKQLSEQGLDPVDGAMKVENGAIENSSSQRSNYGVFEGTRQVKHLGEKADNKQTNSGTIAQDCKDSKAVV